MDINQDNLIKRPFVLLVEGVTDRAMLGEYMRNIALTFPEYQIMPYGGKNKFKVFLKNITQQDKFKQVMQLAILRDADDNASSAFQSIHYHLTHNGRIPAESVPEIAQAISTNATGLKVGVFIVPNSDSAGALEDLLLASLSNEMCAHIRNYIKGSKAYLAEDGLSAHQDNPKSYSYAYSALFGMENFRDTFRKSVWDWQHPAFQPLQDFLRQFSLH